MRTSTSSVRVPILTFIAALLAATAIAGEKSVSRCIYTPDVLARPRLRGVMSGGGNMREDESSLRPSEDTPRKRALIEGLRRR